MLNSFKLLLPALIPSWRFFDVIAPSPRLEFALLKSPRDVADYWHEFRPRPAQLSFITILCRLFWNPAWNESLFLVSCAERMMENPTEHNRQEILARIKTDLRKNISNAQAASYLQFRLVFISRHKAELRKEFRFISLIYPLAEDTAL